MVVIIRLPEVVEIWHSGAGSISKVGAQIPALCAGKIFFTVPPPLFRGAPHYRAL